MKIQLCTLCTLASLALPALGQQQRVRVTFENLAPAQGTFQTPLWVAFHDGSFDMYDLGAPAGEPLERLAEDGQTSVLAADFLVGGAGTVEGTIPGPDGPLAPGQKAGASFLLDPLAPSSTYLSYASMVVPSNDAFVANDDPMAIHVFLGPSGQFIAPNTFVVGQEVLDAGTELNDEVPMNTALLGQTTPDTGVDEGGVVTAHPGFLPMGSGGILDQPRFAEADFTDPGYPMAKIRLEHAPAITGFRRHHAYPKGSGEVPPVATPASGRGTFLLVDGGTKVRFFFRFENLNNVVGAHLHLGSVGQNGPIVVNLVDPALGDAEPFPLPPAGGAFPQLLGEFDASALVGPLEAQPLDRLMALTEEGQVYVNVHTDDGMPGQNTGPGDFQSGEVRSLVRLD